MMLRLKRLREQLEFPRIKHPVDVRRILERLPVALCPDSRDTREKAEDGEGRGLRVVDDLGDNQAGVCGFADDQGCAGDERGAAEGGGDGSDEGNHHEDDGEDVHDELFGFGLLMFLTDLLDGPDGLDCVLHIHFRGVEVAHAEVREGGREKMLEVFDFRDGLIDNLLWIRHVDFAVVAGFAGVVDVNFVVVTASRWARARRAGARRAWVGDGVLFSPFDPLLFDAVILQKRFVKPSSSLIVYS